MVLCASSVFGADNLICGNGYGLYFFFFAAVFADIFKRDVGFALKLAYPLLMAVMEVVSISVSVDSSAIATMPTMVFPDPQGKTITP